MKTTILLLVMIFASFAARAYFFEVQAVGRSGTKSSSREIFADKSGIQTYRVSISCGLKEPARKFTLSGITIVKTNQRRKFQFAVKEVATNVIECVPGRKTAATYVTCRTSAMDDNWKDVGSDLSCGLVVLGATIEITDDEGKRRFVWSNQSGVYRKGIKEVFADKETAFQHSEEQWERWERYVKGADKGYNYWKMDVEKE